MMKRWIALLLALALLAPSLAAAASERTMAGQLVKHAYTTDDNVWREYTLDANSVAVEMKPQEHLIYMPIHWVDSNYLSYDIEDVYSSNEDVVAVSSYQPSRYRSVGNGELGVIGNYENIGVRMYALKPGKATVTVKYATYLSRLGLNYNDMRGTPHQTKVFEITVGSPLEMEVTIKAPGYEKVPHVVIQMMKMDDAMDSDVRAVSQFKAALDNIRDWFLGKGLSKIGNNLFDIADKAVKKEHDKGLTTEQKYEERANAWKKGRQSFNVFDNLSSIWSIAKGFADQINTQSKWQELKIPAAGPLNTYLEIKLTNTSKDTIGYDKLIVDCSPDVSVYHSITRMFGKTRVADEPGQIAPGETKIITLPVNPALSYGDSSDPYEGRHAYDAWINVGCNYSMNGEKSFIERRTEFSAFSYLTREDLIQLNKAMGENGKFYQKYFGYRSLPHMFRISCPVEVAVLDAQGNELTAIRSNDETVYGQDNVYAFADGEDKYVLLPQGQLANYRLRIHALEDGTMDVDSLACTGTVKFNGYEQIPLKAGDLFEIKLEENKAGELCRVAESGEFAPLESTAAFNDETYVQILEQTGVSPWALGAVKQMQYIPLPESIESFQQQVTREEFASILVSRYEWVNDILFGTLASEFEGEQKVGESPVIAAADSLELAPAWQDVYAQGSAAQPVTVGEAAETLLNQMIGRGYLTAEDGDESAALAGDELLLVLRDVGLMRTEGLVDLKAQDPLTAEAALAMLYEVDLYQGSVLVRNMMPQNAFNNVTGALLGVAATGKEGAPAIGVINNGDHGLSLDSVLMYTIGLDAETVLTQGPEARANAILAQLQSMSKKWSKYSDQEIPANLKALKQKKGLKPLKAYPGSVKTIPNEDGSLTISALVWFDDKGTIFENAVYEYTGVLYYSPENGAYTLMETISADQTSAAAHMLAYYEDLKWFSAKALAVEYPELAKDMTGDEVKALQEKLKELGFYSGKADGKYSKKVVTAVKKFQKSMGLEQTGTADSQTQTKLFTQGNVDILLLEWFEGKMK